MLFPSTNFPFKTPGGNYISSCRKSLIHTSAASVSACRWLQKHLFLDWFTASTWSSAFANRCQAILWLAHIYQPLWKLGCTPCFPLNFLTHAQSSACQIDEEFTLVTLGGGWVTISSTAKSDWVAFCFGKLEIISLNKSRCWVQSYFVEPNTNL